MKLDVAPLMNAIERYLAKSDESLEKTLTAEGFVAAAEAVKEINKIEDAVAEATKEDVKVVIASLTNAEDVETFLAEIWDEVKDESELKERLREVFYQEFQNMVKQFTYEWLLDSSDDVAELFHETPRITAPTQDFISSWSTQLADLMHLSSQEQIENVLRKAKEEHLTIEETADLIAEKGIRDAGYQARRVATTEVLRMESYAHQEAMVQNPLAYAKRWKHIMSGHPRENHMAMEGQQVFKRETFTLIGRDGATYHPLCPRDTSLPAGESINCHCIMQEIKNESALGMSKAELRKLREEAMDEVDAEWATDHASDKVNVILGMDEEDQVRYFGGKKDGKARLALVKSGVVDTDEKLEKLYKTEESGKKSLKSLQELTDDGIFTVDDKALKHSTIGEYTTDSNRLDTGGHGQTCINKLAEDGKPYVVTKTYENGVRIGYVPDHKKKLKNGDPSKKDSDIGQAWFPEFWTDEDIRNAGTYVANTGKMASNDIKFETYNGVRIGIFTDQFGNPATIFPDNMRQPRANGTMEGARV